jgi:hypothetical protein
LLAAQRGSRVGFIAQSAETANMSARSDAIRLSQITCQTSGLSWRVSAVSRPSLPMTLDLCF